MLDSCCALKPRKKSGQSINKEYNSMMSPRSKARLFKRSQVLQSDSGRNFILLSCSGFVGTLELYNSLIPVYLKPVADTRIFYTNGKYIEFDLKESTLKINKRKGTNWELYVTDELLFYQKYKSSIHEFSDKMILMTKQDQFFEYINNSNQ